MLLILDDKSYSGLASFNDNLNTSKYDVNEYSYIS